MSLFSLLWLTIFYNLSIRATRFIKYLLTAAALQTTAIYLYHPSLKTVLMALNLFALLAFLTTLALTPRSVPGSGDIARDWSR